MAMVQPPQAGPPTGMPSAIGERGGLYPRWPFLAAILLVPLTIVAYMFHLFDHWLGIFQVLALWAVFLLLWLLCFVLGLQPLELETPDPANAPIAYFFWNLSNFGRVRPLLVGYGCAAFIGIGAAAYLGKLAPLVLAWGVIVMVVAICALFWHPRAPAQAQSAQALWQQTLNQTGSPWYVFRSIPPFNRLFPPRAPQPPANPGQPANPPMQIPTQPGN